MLDEFAEGEESCRKNPEVQAALAKRGITDMSLVCFEPWSVGYFGEDDEGRRLMRALVFVREEPDDSPYAHPIENFIVIVDLNSGEVVKVEDDQAIPVPSRERQLPAQVRRRGPHRPQADLHHPARRRVLHGHRKPRPVGRLVLPRRLHPPRGPGPAPAALPQQGRRTSRHQPGLALRNGRPLRGHRPRPGQEERLRLRRIQHRQHGQLPHPGLRLPRRNQVLRRHHRRQPRQPADHRERHLHARGRRLHPLEALRLPRRHRRNPPQPQARDLLHRHRRELRVRLLLAPLPRRQSIEFLVKATGILSTAGQKPGREEPLRAVR